MGGQKFQKRTMGGGGSLFGTPEYVINKPNKNCYINMENIVLELNRLYFIKNNTITYVKHFKHKFLGARILFLSQNWEPNTRDKIILVIVRGLFIGFFKKKHLHIKLEKSKFKCWHDFDKLLKKNVSCPINDRKQFQFKIKNTIYQDKGWANCLSIAPRLLLLKPVFAFFGKLSMRTAINLDDLLLKSQCKQEKRICSINFILSFAISKEKSVICVNCGFFNSLCTL